VDLETLLFFFLGLRSRLSGRADDDGDRGGDENDSDE